MGVDEVVDSLKKAFGLDYCKNGGTYDRYLEQCRCRKYFKGKECEIKTCANGAELTDGNCVCPDETHFAGVHCETLSCDNNGRADVRKPGFCKCPASYTGRYCEVYSNPWGIIIGSVAGILLLLILIWMACQWYWSKREFDVPPSPTGGARSGAMFNYRNRLRQQAHERNLRLVMPNRPFCTRSTVVPPPNALQNAQNATPLLTRAELNHGHIQFQPPSYDAAFNDTVPQFDTSPQHARQYSVPEMQSYVTVPTDAPPSYDEAVKSNPVIQRATSNIC